MDDLTNLVPEVRSFATPAYALADELTHLRRVHQAGAPEAVILYAARMIEALSIVGVERAGASPSENSFANLTMLERDGFLAGPILYWAHGLRRLGNDVRHLLRKLTVSDAEVALAYAECWLDWFFCRFKLGPPLPGTTHDGSPLALASDNTWREVVVQINRQGDAQAMLSIATLPGFQHLAAATPTVTAVLAEVLIHTNEPRLAETILLPALERFPADLRLRQLQGLVWSSTGELDRASEALELLRSDEETVGILGGVYKRMWKRQPREHAWLEKSRAAYLSGWKASKCSNIYLGINAAATALWLGNKATSQNLATQVRQFFVHRHQRLGKLGLSEPVGDYWEAVTLAEAELLLENYPAANQAYRDALSRFPEWTSAIAGTREQAVRNLAALGRPATEDILPALFVETATRVTATQPAQPVAPDCQPASGHRPPADEVNGDAS